MSTRTIAPVSGPTKTYIADSAIVAGTSVVSGGAQGHCAAASAAGQRSLGIADVSVVAGIPVRVTRSGDTPATAGAAITHGQYVKADANGLMVPAGASGSGDEVVGRAESDAAASGDQIIVFVSPFVI